ncbi:21 kDa protein-like [Vigna unguiculata]|uniref:pectinesterase n=1 Tax=Vigna unguiculata TaxID=3917 RepID=A0A4D6LL12_VIGUN|nr:21 kDa protein-like [Vigna unguiculata]QCD89015.1 elongation factor G [Vigna unguiculata]
MEAISSKHLLTNLLVIFSCSLVTLCANTGTERPHQQASTVFIRTSCSSTTYPRLCYSSLVRHAELIQTNRVVLTGTALNVSLASAKSTAAVISTMAKRQGLKPREAAAMKDCVEVLNDSVDELRRSIDGMSHLRSSNFEMTMSDVQTWVSAALTDENTCTDGFQEIAAAATTTATVGGGGSNTKTRVRGLVVQVAQLTSNALALINQLANHG